MRAVVFTQTFVVRLDGREQHFTGAEDLKRVNTHEIYIDTRQGVQRLLKSVADTPIKCRDVDLTANPNWRLPLRLNGAPGKPRWLPLDNDAANALRQRIKPGRPLRIAIFNAFGTALGDNLAGMQAFRRLLLPVLESVSPWLEIDVLRSWASRKPEQLLRHEPWVHRVAATPLTLHDWLGYDAYFDFSGFTGLAGFLDCAWPDFHLQHLGIDPAQVPGTLKAASHPLRQPRDFERGYAEVVEQAPDMRGPRVFLHATASNPLRTIPPAALAQLVQGLRDAGAQLVTDDRAVVLAARRVSCPLVWVRDRSLDELRGALAAVDSIVTSDTYLMHVACLGSRPILALVVAHQRYAEGMLPWQGNLTVLEVDRERRFPGRYKMTAEEIAQAGLADYFEGAWQRAAEQALEHLRSVRCTR